MLQKDLHEQIHFGIRPNLLITKEEDFVEYMENLKLEHRVISSYSDEGHTLKELQEIKKLVSDVYTSLAEKQLKDATGVREPFVYILDLSTVKSISEEEKNLLFNLVSINRNSLVYLTLVDKHSIINHKSTLDNLICYEELV